MRLLKYLFLLGLFGAVVAAAGLAGLVWHYSKELPSTAGLKDLRLQEPLRIYTRDGALIGEFGAERREPLAYNEIPPQLINAFLAAEDDRFFEHPGVDYQGLLRAAWVLITTGEKAQGGSTITMQLTRNFFLSAEKSYVRKFKEILLSLEMEQQLSKEDILRFYLNKIFLGHRAYGIGAAAKVYYDSELDELSLSQMAMIAGLPKAPSRYNPISGPQRALLRRNYVLRRMRELGYINQAQYDEALSEEITAKLRRSIIDSEAHYVAEYVRGRVVNQFGTDAYTTGMQVVTTLDYGAQAKAVKALRENLLAYDQRHDWRAPTERLEGLAENVIRIQAEDLAILLEPLMEEYAEYGDLEPAVYLGREDEQIVVFATRSGRQALRPQENAWANADWNALKLGDILRVRQVGEQWELAQLPEVQGAIVAMDPETGAVRALTGGFDYFASKFNRAMQAKRQPGSAFKPFVYSAALEHGFHVASIINDAPVVFDDPELGGAWRPQNYTGKFYGPTRVREGLVRSSNLVSIRLLDTIGIDTVRRHAQKFGFESRRLPRNLSLALGTGSYSPLEMAGAYSILANGGFSVTPHLIEQIRDAQGEVLYQANPARACRECPERLGTAPQVIDLPGDGENEGSEEEAEAPPPVILAEQAISAENAYIVTHMMQDVIKRGTGRRARSLGRKDLAGKTGTTNDQRDAWFCGFNAEHVAVAWIGFDDITPLGSKETGGRAALPMWMSYMGQALADSPNAQLPQPEGVVSARINPETGQMARYGEAGAIFELFIDGRLPEAPPQDEYASDPYDPYSGQSTGGSSEEEVLEELF